MRLRNVKNAEQILNNSKIVINNPKEYKGKFKTLFNNDNKICLEIGMGKGDFIINMAKENPNTNFVGVEKYASVLVRGVQKAQEFDLPNLRMINIDAKELSEVFDHEIDAIYLNFSDPWPKKRHADRRLTSHIFLKVYDDLFANDKTIIQKTDNIILFASSISSLSTYGYTLQEVTLDLHNEDIPNIRTEYEEKFSGLGFKINRLKAVKKLEK